MGIARDIDTDAHTQTHRYSVQQAGLEVTETVYVLVSTRRRTWVEATFLPVVDNDDLLFMDASG